MKVVDLIKRLEEFPPDTEVEAFGVDSSGKFSLRPVSHPILATKRTATHGSEGLIVYIDTHIYDIATRREP